MTNKNVYYRENDRESSNSLKTTERCLDHCRITKRIKRRLRRPLNISIVIAGVSSFIILCKLHLRILFKIPNGRVRSAEKQRRSFGKYVGVDLM